MKKETIIRTITLALALLNQIFAIFGIKQLNLGEDTIYQLVSAVVTVAAAVWAWWKNNSFTKEAQYADEVLAGLKSEKKYQQEQKYEDEEKAE